MSYSSFGSSGSSSGYGGGSYGGGSAAQTYVFTRAREKQFLIKQCVYTSQACSKESV